MSLAHLSGSQSRDRPQGLSSETAGPVAQLTKEALAPAVARTSRGPPTGVEASGTELYKVEVSRHWHGSETSHRSAVAQLAVAVDPPTIGSVGRALSAGVTKGCGHPFKGESACDRSGPEAQVGLAIAELSVSAVAPAEGPLGSADRAGVVIPRVQLAEAVAPATGEGFKR